MIPIVVKGHERPINQLKYNTDGDLLFSISHDRRVCIWFSDTGELFGTTDKHGGAVNCIDIDRKSTFFITCSTDFAIQFWNLKTGELLEYEHENKEGEVVRGPMRIKYSAIPRFLQIHPDENKLLLVQDTKMNQPSAIVIYDIDMHDLENPVLKQNKVIYPKGSPYVKAVWTYDGKRIIAAHQDGSVSRTCVETGECELSAKVHNDNIVDLQMSQDRSYFITASRDETAVLLPVDGDFQTMKKKFQGDTGLNSAAISPIKDIIIAGGGKKSIEVTTSSGGKFEAHFFNKLFQADLGRVGGHFGPINSIAIHPYGTSYASGSEDGTIRIHHFDKSYFEFDYNEVIKEGVEDTE
ncbi:translation initiation factor eIF3 subunit I [Starmerella bacillaris]|uniref:Serine-threonine kinase receptor-associated protein n=1 Tax=Starmerella bacillaris TaxID=1247836 RepID=A0AAV5RKG6_STABA|nr:translation initiation factor eIF3 subunit I [Starmerella bacillaris]